MGKPPPICDGTLSVRQASRLMGHDRVVLVRTPAGLGIVTDSDLRKRVIAPNLSFDTSVSEVMTFPLKCTSPERSADDVVAEMLEAKIHQLPVMADGSLVGMVSDVQLLAADRMTPFAFRSQIDRAASSEELIRIGLELPLLTISHWRSGVDAEHIGRWLGILTDHLTVRLLDLTMSRMGPAPADWTWLALGSFGRREQSLTSDQDHALIYADGAERHATYFAELSETVVSALEAIGFSRCPSSVMASDPGWRMPLAEWADRLRFWIMETDRAATFFSGIIFDYRPIAGPLQAAPTIDRVAGRAQGNEGFIRRAVALAIRHPRPLGFLNRFKVGTESGGSRGLDIKHSGLFPIIEVARALALESSLGPPSTLDRLRRVAARPEWSEPATALIQVFKALQQVRLQAHMTALEEGRTVSDLLEPKALDRLTRLHIKDDFRVLQTVLDEMAFRFGIHR